MPINPGMMSSNRDDWATPQKLFDDLNVEFGFTLDPCASHENAKCAKYYTKEDDGLAQSWQDEVVFMNPPYGREIGKWVEKAYRESVGGGGSGLFAPCSDRYPVVPRLHFG